MARISCEFPLANSFESCVLKYEPHKVSIANMKMNVIITNNTVGFKSAVWIFFIKSLVSFVNPINLSSYASSAEASTATPEAPLISIF